MPVLLNADASFSSMQELLDLQESSANGGLSLGTPSPVDPHIGSPIGLGPTGPSSLRSDGPHIYTVASTLPDQLYGEKAKPSAETLKGSRLHSADSDEFYGWGTLKPKALQFFNTPRWVLFFLCVNAFLQGLIVSGLSSTVVTTIERRFDLSSHDAGLIVSCYDIACCVCLAFVTYFGGTGHKPRWLGWGLLIMAVGSIMFILPHFTTPPYQVSQSERTGLCSANSTSPAQETKGGGLSGYRFVFMLSQFLLGVGGTPLYTLGVTYLDENVQSSYAPVYLGIFYTASIVGPAAGYMLGGYTLSIFTHTNVVTQVSTEDPLWVGAWWIGFLAAGAATALVAFPILGFPQQLPGSQEHLAMRVSEAHQLKHGSHATALDPQFGKTLKDMPRSVLLLLRNPTFLFLCLASATEATIASGIATFSPKIFQSQFSLSASKAATLLGIIVIPAGCSGTFLGGYIVKRLNLRCRGIINFCMTCTLCCLLLTFPLLLHCPTVAVAGVTVSYQSSVMDQRQLDEYEHLSDKPSSMQLKNSSSPVRHNLTAGCNAQCDCARELYNPVCGEDGVTYYSQCYAGCSSINQTESSTSKKVYSGCSCLLGNGSGGEEGYALAGMCDVSCNILPVFVAFFYLSAMFALLCSIPTVIATLRCVPDSQKSFALGIQSILFRLLGTIPGPIVFGSLIDKSCILWQDHSSELGSCYLYENSAMSRRCFTASIVVRILSIAFYMLASILYRPPPDVPPTSGCETPDHAAGDTSDLPVTDLPDDGVIVNPHAK
ncbi:solute carrier organic anion transporter family member 4A1 isoform X1 [Solea solea]|uniref:solute carrier organic anion transporter family member 4A1 isoform X1 n=1 Tax=Solea solea TaxID=90069 RepID=UPI00272BD17E|nr:solute carrier organic anion transporter family member 4A1 isoform X1 [Solea solea]